jgi:hypothetical protein
VTNKPHTHHQAFVDEAELQRKLCRNWLLDAMSGSEKTQTKNGLRAEATERFKVSKSAFERAWTSVGEEIGQHGQNDLRRRAGSSRKNSLEQI